VALLSSVGNAIVGADFRADRQGDVEATLARGVRFCAVWVAAGLPIKRNEMQTPRHGRPYSLVQCCSFTVISPTVLDRHVPPAAR
jgi:hypothetical protein